MSNFYINVFGLKRREPGKDFIALENELFELVLLKTAITEALNTEKNEISKIRKATPIKPVFIIDKAIEKVRASVKSLGGGFKASETEWKFNGYIVCDGWDPEGNIFQVRSMISR